jgi:hypothetical protein
MVQSEVHHLQKDIPMFRSLKICEVGDFYRKTTKPEITLSGKWLQQAGFEPNKKVNVVSNKPGELILTVVENQCQSN